MVSDPLSQLTAVFVPSGNDPPSTHCGWLCMSYPLPCMLSYLARSPEKFLNNYYLLASSLEVSPVLITCVPNGPPPPTLTHTHSVPD